jgi:hypothetical protein
MFHVRHLIAQICLSNISKNLINTSQLYRNPTKALTSFEYLTYSTETNSASQSNNSTDSVILSDSCVKVNNFVFLLSLDWDFVVNFRFKF